MRRVLVLGLFAFGGFVWLMVLSDLVGIGWPDQSVEWIFGPTTIANAEVNMIIASLVIGLETLAIVIGGLFLRNKADDEKD